MCAVIYKRSKLPMPIVSSKTQMVNGHFLVGHASRMHAKAIFLGQYVDYNIVLHEIPCYINWLFQNLEPVALMSVFFADFALH